VGRGKIIILKEMGWGISFPDRYIDPSYNDKIWMLRSVLLLVSCLKAAGEGGWGGLWPAFLVLGEQGLPTRSAPE
jgi:hypothetical protein